MAWNAELIGQYPSLAAMVSAAAAGPDSVAHGTIGLILTEPGNIYSFNSGTNKWIVHSFNRYTTAQITALSVVEIPIYTHIINVDTGDVIIEDGL